MPPGYCRYIKQWQQALASFPSHAMLTIRGCLCLCSTACKWWLLRNAKTCSQEAIQVWSSLLTGNPSGVQQGPQVNQLLHLISRKVNKRNKQKHKHRLETKRNNVLGWAMALDSSQEPVGSLGTETPDTCVWVSMDPFASTWVLTFLFVQGQSHCWGEGLSDT